MTAATELEAREKNETTKTLLRSRRLLQSFLDTINDATSVGIIRVK